MITAFIPCRKGSQRIPNKNIRSFANVSGGLLEIKLFQLLECADIDKIVVSTNDDIVLNYCRKINNSKILIDKRPDYLGTSETSTDELIDYVSSLIPRGEILWTHVTSPFVTADIYEVLLKQYFLKLQEGFDSLMTAKEIQGFLWDRKQSINYNRNKEKWPRTQTISPIYEVDSAAFIANADIYKLVGDRIGKHPYIFPQDKICSIDIDWPEDFKMAEIIYKNYVRR